MPDRSLERESRGSLPTIGRRNIRAFGQSAVALMITACAPQSQEVHLSSDNQEDPRPTLLKPEIGQPVTPETSVALAQRVASHLRGLTNPSVNDPLIKQIETIGNSNNDLAVESSGEKFQIVDASPASHRRQILAFSSQGDPTEGAAKARIETKINSKGQLGNEPDQPLSEKAMLEALKAGIKIPKGTDKPLVINVGENVIAMQVRFWVTMVQLSPAGEIIFETAEPLPFPSSPYNH